MMKREFYVGYLPVPSGLKRRLLMLIPLLLITALVVAALVPAEQEDPGTGQWNLNQADTFTGVLQADPYPALVVRQDDGGVQTILLASQVKTGVRKRVSELNNQSVTLRGNLAERDGYRLLTLLDDESAIELPEATVTLETPIADSRGRFQLTGQIIDPKCYLGAMKPGEGKIHKACATLCIKGGIPPMFMTRNVENKRVLYLLTDLEGRALFDPIESFIADPITAEGIIEQHGDLAWFKIDPTTIERLK